MICYFYTTCYHISRGTYSKYVRPQMEPFYYHCSNCITIRVSKNGFYHFVLPFKQVSYCSLDLYIFRNVNTSKLSPGLAFRFPLSSMLKPERYCEIHIHTLEIPLFHYTLDKHSKSYTFSYYFHLAQGVKSDVRTSSGMFLTHVERSYPIIQVGHWLSNVFKSYVISI